MSGKYTEYVIGVWRGGLPGISVGLGGGMSGAGDHKVIRWGKTSTAGVEISFL